MVTNGRVLTLHDPASGFRDEFQAGDFALLDMHAQGSQAADQVHLGSVIGTYQALWLGWPERLLQVWLQSGTRQD